jgi:hypothetical protein
MHGLTAPTWAKPKMESAVDDDLFVTLVSVAATHTINRQLHSCGLR